MEKKTQKEKVQELTERLEQGVKEVFESGAYENYLKVMSKFHRYSFRNTILIWMQKPDATHVAGYDAWKKDFNRQVKKGEKGIRIFAPTEYKVKVEKQKIDQETNLPMVDGEGKPVMETVKEKRNGFMATTVFDVSQTEGEPLPELVKSLNSKVENYEAFVTAIERVSPVPIVFEQIGVSDGYYSLHEEKIHIDEDLGPTVRSGDITEILVSDLLEFIFSYSVPRYKQKNRSGKNNSEHGTDVIAYRFFNDSKIPSEKDELIATEVKALLTSTGYDSLENAIVESKKDEQRLARTIDHCRKRLKELGHIEQSVEISRFLLKPDNNYKLTYAAAGISSRQVVDQEIELSTSGEQLHIRKSQEIFYIHGKTLMDLTHEIYERCKR